MLVSTRDINKKEIKESEAIIEGLASDGGLYVRQDIPLLSNNELSIIKDYDYYSLASFILSKYLGEFTREELYDLISKSYKSKFDIDSCVNITKTKDAYVLELYHGPTCAFKDMALLVLPNLLDASFKKNDKENKTIILTATSGDTGSSALNGFKETSTLMIVFYPTDGVSKIQERQMLKLRSVKAKVIAIEGNFDDAQRLVKKIFNDVKLKEELNGYRLSSANSINIGRLLPQIVYYFKAYFDLVKKNEICFGDAINFSVPTGNFGDILAGFMAYKMGLPVNKLICASNSNDVLTEFFNTRVYNKNRVFYKTISPSMDILVSSNLERLLYYVTKSPDVTRELMKNLDEKGLYKLDEKYDLSLFSGKYLDEKETKEVIKKVYNENKYLIDPHTAVSYGALLKYRKDTKDNTKTVVLSTAHPYKFPVSVLDSLGESLDEEFSAIASLEKMTGIVRPKMIKELDNSYKKEVWKKEEAYNKAIKLIKELSHV